MGGRSEAEGPSLFEAMKLSASERGEIEIPPPPEQIPHPDVEAPPAGTEAGSGAPSEDQRVDRRDPSTDVADPVASIEEGEPDGGVISHPASSASFAPAPTWSFSRLSTYQQCGRKYRLSYIEKVPQIPQGAFIFGRSVHATIEESEKQGWWQDMASFRVRVGEEHATVGPGAEFFADTFNEELKEAGGPSKVRWSKSSNGKDFKDEGWCHANGPLQLTRYAATRQSDDALGHRLIDIEAKVMVELVPAMNGDPPVMVQGYLDCVGLVDAETGEYLYIRDWKTGSYADPFQLATYSVLYEIARGIVITEGQIVKLGVNDREKRIVDFDLTDLRPLVLDKYASVARRLRREEEWDWENSSFCVSCPVRLHCPWGRTLGEKGGDG